MTSNAIRVLIAEDDPTQGQALFEAFSRAGYAASLCSTSANALATARHTEFQILVVDCMLPKMNGVDLVLEIQKQLPRKAKVFMISGVFKDRKFIRDTIARTEAEAFLPKPIPLDHLLGQVKNAVDSIVERGTPPLMALYSSRHLPDEELLHLLENEGSIHALHLPMLFQRLQESNLTGKMVLLPCSEGPSAVDVYEGKIFSVRTPDKESYFGAIAVDKGFVAPDEVVNALSANDPKPIGERLIASMSLSPHAIQIILVEQLALRLSRTIQNEMVSVKWASQKFPNPEFWLDESRFQALLEAWVESKMKPEWIRSTLLTWGQHMIEGQFHDQIKSRISLDQLLSDKKFRPDRDLPYLLQSLWSGEAFLSAGEFERANEFEFLELRLNQMVENIKSQNFFELLGVGEKAQSLELNKAYESFRDAYDPAKLPPNCPPALVVTSTQVFQKIEEAYRTLRDDIARSKYLTRLERERAELLLSNEPLFRTAILELQSGKVKRAVEKFQSLIDKGLNFRDLKAYRIWAGLKYNPTYSKITLEQVPPEERHSLAYYVAKGMTLRMKGRYQKAVQAYHTAQMIDPTSSAPRREMEDLRRNLKRRGIQRGLQREISELIESLKSRSRYSA